VALYWINSSGNRLQLIDTDEIKEACGSFTFLPHIIRQAFMGCIQLSDDELQTKVTLVGISSTVSSTYLCKFLRQLTSHGNINIAHHQVGGESPPHIAEEETQERWRVSMFPDHTYTIEPQEYDSDGAPVGQGM
jgi:hypothetical protein